MIRKNLILLALSASCLNVWAADSGMPFLGGDDDSGTLPALSSSVYGQLLGTTGANLDNGGESPTFRESDQVDNSDMFTSTGNDESEQVAFVAFDDSAKKEGEGMPALSYEPTSEGMPALDPDAARTSSPVEDSAAAAATSSTTATTSTPSSSLAEAIRGLEELSPLDLVVASITRGDAQHAEDAKKLLGLLTPEELAAVEDILPHARYFASCTTGYSGPLFSNPEIESVLPRREKYPSFIFSIRAIVENTILIRRSGGIRLENLTQGQILPTSLTNFVDTIKFTFPNPRSVHAFSIMDIFDLVTEYRPSIARELIPNIREVLLNSEDLETQGSYTSFTGIKMIIEVSKLKYILDIRGWRWPETIEGYKEAFKELRDFVRPRD